MEAKLLRFPNKAIRAQAIKEYIAGLYDGVVCFSCGNASRELKNAGVNTLDISPTGDLIANRWFTHKDIKKAFPTHFDATSGHLPVELMADIARRFRTYLGELPDGEYYVPTGSGETIFCLSLAYPDKKFAPVYNLDAATKYDEENVFNVVVEMITGRNGI